MHAAALLSPHNTRAAACMQRACSLVCTLSARCLHGICTPPRQVTVLENTVVDDFQLCEGCGEDGDTVQIGGEDADTMMLSLQTRDVAGVLQPAGELQTELCMPHRVRTWDVPICHAILLLLTYSGSALDRPCVPRLPATRTRHELGARGQW